MIEEERQRIKAQLIELGLWDANERGDPTTNLQDSGILQERLEAKLAQGVYLISEMPTKGSLAREILIFHEGETYKLANAPSYIEAICLAALALPEFLRQHPECAARNEEGVKKGKQT
jgi:hypothetical protein